MDQIGIRVSCPDKTVAEPIGRAAVEARLAACAHVWPIRSSYRWQELSKAARNGRSP